MSSVNALNAALGAAGPGLVGNDEVLRSVLAGSGDCIKILDLDGRLQFMSEGGQRVMEVEDFTKLKGCPWPDFWEGAGHDAALASIAAARLGQTRRFRHAANTAKGNPRIWDVEVSPISNSSGQPQYLLSISRDVTKQVEAELSLAESVQRQRWLMEELAHRLKNTLTSIISIARQTFRGAEFDASRDVFLGRIQLLDSANDLITKAQRGNVAIFDVVAKALAPYRSGEGRFSISGPPVEISARPASALMLALHELATNALKYGALSNDIGRIEIRWSVDGTGEASTFTFAWQERDGPPVVAPKRRGFGTQLITRLVSSDLGGQVELNYAAEGVTFRVASPLRTLRETNSAAA